ncbi:MAG: NAD(P)H-dependent oxidoreductase subunit E [Oscillospiraceae bacterium]|nr:NAD(P)H-dependent oxidoreductase subunit E [Oscillospiraceae bacterium]
MAWDLDEAIGYYKSQGAPGDQNALVALLREAQQENGGVIPAHVPAAAAEAYGVKESFLLALIRRIPSLRLSDRHVLELCCGKNCGRKNAELLRYAETRQGPRLEVRQGGCMRLCGKGPNIRLDGRVYHKADRQLLEKLLAELGI